MHVVGQVLDAVREAHRIRQNVALLVSLQRRPAVCIAHMRAIRINRSAARARTPTINVDVFVAKLWQSESDHGVGDLDEQLHREPSVSCACTTHPRTTAIAHFR
jgi:hypothetical protein